VLFGTLTISLTINDTNFTMNEGINKLNLI